MKTKEELTQAIHEIAKEFSSHKVMPWVTILQPRRDNSEIPAQQLISWQNRHIDTTSIAVGFHSVDGYPVDLARCILMDKAIEDNPKYVLFVDEDTALPRQGLMNLIKTSKQYPDAIISGIYYVKFGNPMICIKDELGRAYPADVTPNSGIIRDVSVGLGCALIPMHIIYKIRETYPEVPLFCIVPDNTWEDNIVRMGEDTWFYNLVAKCGFETIGDTAVHCLHMELSTGKYSAHPDVNLDDYATNIPVTERLVEKDITRVARDYMNRYQSSRIVNGLDSPINKLPIQYTDDTVKTIEAKMKRVQCTQNYYEIAMLCEKLKELQPQTILEIGMGTGGSMNIWGEFAAPDAFLVGVDTDKQVTETYVHNNREQKLTFVIGDSTFPMTLGMVKQTLGNRKVDFLFIDGAHDETVRSDYELYSPLVREGGIIALHDIDTAFCVEETTSVRKLWSELKEMYSNTDEFINTEAEYRYGIGVIYV
jgi:predicted O-methyltransferase YrrM